MRVFVFDLLPYAEHLDHLKQGKELPWPLPRRHFKPEVAVRTYAEHLDAWEEMDRLGYDGVGFNEHHTSPYGLMNSPEPDGRLRRPAHAAAQAADLRQPAAAPRPAPAGRGAGDARLPVERAASSPASPAASRASTTSTTCRYAIRAPASRRRGRSSAAPGPKRSSPTTGRFWSYDDVAIWPRPVQQPHPPVWVPVTGSKETIEWAGRHNIPITPGPGAHARPARGHHPLLRALPGPARSPAHARPPDHPGERLRRRQQGPGGEGSRALHALLQPDAVQPRQHQRGLAAARRGLSELGLVRLRATREPGGGLGRPRALPRHDDGRRGARRRADAVGHARRGDRADHRRPPTTPAPTPC